MPCWGCSVLLTARRYISIPWHARVYDVRKSHESCNLFILCNVIWELPGMAACSAFCVRLHVTEWCQRHSNISELKEFKHIHTAFPWSPPPLPSVLYSQLYFILSSIKLHFFIIELSLLPTAILNGFQSFKCKKFFQSFRNIVWSYCDVSTEISVDIFLKGKMCTVFKMIGWNSSLWCLVFQVETKTH